MDRAAGGLLVWRDGIEPDARDEWRTEAIDLLRFFAGFLASAMDRVLVQRLPQETSAFFDADGTVVCAGQIADGAFPRHCGARWRRRPIASDGPSGRRLAGAFSAVMADNGSADPVDVPLITGSHATKASLQRMTGRVLRPHIPWCPQVIVTVSSPHGQRRCTRIDARARRYGLTPREVEVVGCVCQGYSSRETSVCLGISEATVKHHLYNVFNKTGVDSRTRRPNTDDAPVGAIPRPGRSTAPCPHR